ncbi:ferric reductase family protein [Aspergillus fijiensis CBS 313.89]|uniref:FAD-binding FR-type domain-containing protein n=1 Tax=Aspergillus fijiensis CBS 313.89 TaxID=1448319 RepID=A0A8G1W2K0_9EURO|nr:uncharacterized protein BO72DRAFT_421729 [Aspergillus fijiensis CBS 313.89]RAK80748.1 hypothetical protein BO72DRAFT_421729 [Aspergillus fijiensis CBS 313.89]
MRITLAILASCLSSHVVAKGFAPSNANQYCMYAIYKSFSSFRWQENTNSTSAVSQGSTRSSAASECTNVLEVTSIYVSMREYCHGRAYTVGLDFWKSLCTNAGLALMDLGEIEAIATTKYIEQLPVFSPGAANSAPISSAVLLDKSYYRRAVRSVTDDSRSLNIAWGIHGFWGSVILIGMISNFLTGVFYCRDAGQTQDPEKPRSPSRLRRLSSSNPISKVYNALNTHLILALSPGTYHQRLLFGGKVPLRVQALVILAFWALGVILACMRYDAYSDDPFNGTLAYQIWDTMGPRLGLLAFACLPWLWVFAGRNNVFIWATGWSFHTFNVLHRHLAILTVLYAIIHSISYTVKYLAYSPSKYTADLETDWFRFGIVATVLMCLMIPFSCGAVRKRSYEAFLIVHVLFGIIIVYALFRHMSKFGAEYTPHLWPVVAIWCFDRLLRLLRLALCNLPIHRSSSVHSPHQTTVTYHPSSDVLQIEIQPATLFTSPRAGHYYYLYQPTTFRGWENHPFTTASVRYSDRGGSSTPPFPDSTTPARTPTEKDTTISTVESRRLPPQSLTASTPTLTFWVRPYTGWTHRLKSQAIAAGNTLHPTLVVEGPYGHSASTALRTFNRIVMIMGGTGIGVATAYLQVLLSSPGGLGHPQIDLHWTVREPALVDQLYRAELGSYSQRPGVRMRFYCSRGLGDAVDGEGVLAGGDVEQGRAPIAQIVARAGAEEEGSVAVVVCGPAEMADLTRAAVRAARRGGATGMEYFEEAYGW